jgi:hypothetical protein
LSCLQYPLDVATGLWKKNSLAFIQGFWVTELKIKGNKEIRNSKNESQTQKQEIYLQKTGRK